MMRTNLPFAVALLAIGCPSLAHAQGALPADWDQKVAVVVKEPERTAKVVAAGRNYDTKRLASLEAMKVSDAEMKAIFLSQKSSVADRQLSLNLLRDDRRKAVLAATDALLMVWPLVSAKEWKEIWPEGTFVAAGPKDLLAPKVQKVLPSIVPDPARLKQAETIAAKLVSAAKSDESARRKSADKLWNLIERYESQRDSFIDLVNDLEERQIKVDDALIAASGELQQVLTPDEWAALVRLVGQEPRGR